MSFADGQNSSHLLLPLVSVKVGQFVPCKMLVYCLRVFCLFVCIVMYFSADYKVSGVKFCRAVHWHPRQGISHFCELCSPEVQSQTNRPACPCCNVVLLGFCDSHAYQVCMVCGRRIGMCGYMAVYKDDVLVQSKSTIIVTFCFFSVTLLQELIFMKF